MILTSTAHNYPYTAHNNPYAVIITFYAAHNYNVTAKKGYLQN